MKGISGGANVKLKFAGEKPEKQMDNNEHIDEIQKAYQKIDNDWLWLHYKTSIGLVAFACIVECVLGSLWLNSDMMTTTVDRFIWKFIFFPSLMNCICIVIETAVMKSGHFSQKQKIYTVSLIFTAVCFILFTVHSAFTATYYFFAVAIVLTTIYASYRLTAVTALVSIISMVISELFIVWDLDKISIFESTLRLGNFLIALCSLIALSVVCMVAIRFEQKKNAASMQMEMERHQLRYSLQMDEITGIFNRKAFHNALKDMEENAHVNHYILAIVDVDHFKGINDHWGHHIGDLCLIEFAKILKEAGKNFTPYRYGGDEFCLLFRNVDMAKAEAVCEQIKSKLNDLYFEGKEMLKLTASFGLAEYLDQMDPVRLFVHADYALYEAKKVRNSVYVYQQAL